MNMESLDEEKPSIIQEIVFYNKPNIRPMILDEILPASTPVRIGKGDIVISHVKRSSSPIKPKKHDFGSFESNDYETEIQAVKNLKNNKSHKNILVPTDEQDQKLAKKPLKNKKKQQKSPLASIDSLNHFFDYEELVDVLESGDTTERTDASKKALKDAAQEKDTESLNIVGEQFERIKTINKEKQSNKSDKIVEKPSTSTAETPQKRRESTREKRPTEKKLLLNEDKKKSAAKVLSSEDKVSPFKTPKKPVQKSAVKSQTTLLNYVTINSKDSVPKSNLSEEKVGKSSKKNSTTKKSAAEEGKKYESPKLTGKSNSKEPKSLQKLKSSNHTSAKKPRGRHEKTEKAKNTSEDQYSDEEVSFKTQEKSRSRHVKSETNDSSDNLKELLDDAQEQVKALDRVEEELQNMFTNGEEAGESKQSKVKKNSTRKAKVPEGSAKRIKKEIEEYTEESSDPLDISEKVTNSEVYDESDEDSRGEWLPSEYAEYKQQHKMKQLNKFSCKFCLKLFPTYYGMRKHRAIEHNDVGRSRKEATYREDVRLKQEHEEDSDAESREEWLPEDYADYKLKHKMNKMKRALWYKCKICCAVFSNYYKLSKHRLEHKRNPNPYQCKECTDSFKDVNSLMIHIRIHQGKDPYSCKKCDKGFKTKEELENHMPIHILKKGPTPPKRFRCDICFKEFVKLCDIERHTRVHTGEKPCECNICHKRFQQSHNLSKHLLTHLHVKPFQCDICHKKFGRIDILNRHLLTHSIEKPFNCKLCEKGFIRQIQLDNHMEKTHPQARSSNPKEEQIETGSVHIDDDQDDDIDEPL